MFEMVIDNNTLWYFPTVVMEFGYKMFSDPDHSGGWIEASYDEGVTWNNIFSDPTYTVVPLSWQSPVTLSNGELGFTGFDTNNHYMTLCWAPNWGTVTPNEIRVRFYYYADADVADSEGWLIDNVNVFPEISHTVEELEEMFQTEETVVTYPNPVHKFLNVFYKISKSEKVSIKIYGLDGKQYFSQNFSHDGRGVFFEIYDEALLVQLPPTFVLITQIGDRTYSNKVINTNGLR